MWPYSDDENNWLSSPEGGPEAGWPTYEQIHYYRRRAELMRSEMFYSAIATLFRAVRRRLVRKDAARNELRGPSGATI